MGQQQSKDELLYQQVNYGNIEGIKSLHREGAALEWMDKEGKTPLIVACMNPELYNVAKTLIELGANVNAYRPGRHAGTPLHHAAKRGLEQTVKLLLSHGANALIMNDDCQTPLDVARIKGFSNVVRAIENHICLFSGWLRELYGPGFLELFAPQLLSRKVWVVVLPCGSRNLRKPFKLELAIYSAVQDAQPRTIVALWKANMEEPNFSLPDPAVIISDISNIPRRWRRRRGIMPSQGIRNRPRGARQTRIKLTSVQESEKQQLQSFCNACKGIPQVMHPAFPFRSQTPVVPATAPSTTEDVELAMAISASLQSASQQRPTYHENHLGSGTETSMNWINPVEVASHSDSSLTGASSQKASSSVCQVEEASSSGTQVEQVHTSSDTSTVVEAIQENPVTESVPTAPPLTDEVIDNGPIHYPSIDASPVDLASPTIENSGAQESSNPDGASSSCVICLDAPVEGACIPCGHMAGCMSCLNEIKGKKWGCPVCRAKIDQVIRLYAV
ncbi:putative E3 ubiquitin-protein ligase XBAT35 isoform X1 [Nicotiana tomentosiformis]|uniref:putative E3 ubiquitin-protein ligase XBAT35 isoform X1 n=1 Tax=Nicotiana tomentosiformis TaxID=4098 RepID=UPI00051C8557|nr:putative E3 ubiquitin-protein ligase XBAT35 isoform X1 [Nicotiana tomentosiformis]